MDTKGYTALMYACERGLSRVAFKLLEFGARACNVTNTTSAGVSARTITAAVPALRPVYDAIADLEAEEARR